VGYHTIRRGMEAQVSYEFHTEQKLHPQTFKTQTANRVPLHFLLLGYAQYGETYLDMLNNRDFCMWRKSFLHKSSSDDDEEKLNEESDTPSSLAVSVDDIDITEK
ncbi:hypothetical protein Tco_1087414, partial [Tanacetum coccineum]